MSPTSRDENKCGSCTACCRVYAIPTLEKPKPAGEWCIHCDIGKACKIYEQRPQLCSDFACLWLQSHIEGHDMAENLRPDRCKVVFSPTTNPRIMAAITMPGSPGAWRKGPAREVIDRMVKAGMHVVVGAPASTRKTMVGPEGEREVQMTEPDETGMQWSTE